MSLLLSIVDLQGIQFPNNENQVRLKVGPYTLRIDVRDQNFQYDCNVVYQVKTGLEIALLSASTTMVLAKGRLSHSQCTLNFSGPLALNPSGTMTLAVTHTNETIPRSTIEKRAPSPTSPASTTLIKGSPTGVAGVAYSSSSTHHRTINSSPRPSPNVHPSIVGVTSAPSVRPSAKEEASRPMMSSPLYTQYLRQVDTKKREYQTINPGASVIVPVEGQQKKLPSHVRSGSISNAGYHASSKDWKGVNSIHITVFGFKNLAFANELDLILRCQIGHHSRLSHIVRKSGSSPTFDTDFHYPASPEGTTIHFDLIEVMGKTVIASSTLDLCSLLTANRARTWNGFLPIDTLGHTSGSLSPMVIAAVTLSPKVLSKAMVASPSPVENVDDDYLNARGINLKHGKMQLVLEKQSDSSDSVSNETRKRGMIKKDHVNKMQYRSIQIVLQSLNNMVDSHGGDPVTGFEVACGKCRTDIPARLAGKNVTANAKFVLPYSGNKYLRFILKDQHGVPIGTQKLNLERYLFDPSTGVCERTIRFHAVDRRHPLHTSRAKARISVIMSTAKVEDPELEMCPQPSVIVTNPDGNAQMLIDSMKRAVHAGKPTPPKAPEGFVENASVLMSHFEKPKVISDEDDPIDIQLNPSFYNGLAEKDDFGFLADLNDLRHVNTRLGAMVDLEKELKEAIRDDAVVPYDRKISVPLVEETIPSPRKENGNVPQYKTYSGLNQTFGHQVEKTFVGASIAQMKQTVNGLVLTEAEDEDGEDLVVMSTATHAFHSFELSTESITDLDLPKSVDKLWLEVKYGGQACPSYHYVCCDRKIDIKHTFEFPIDSVGCKYAHITLYGADSKAKSAAMRCVKFGQAIIDLESFIIGGSTAYEQVGEVYCFPVTAATGVDLRATMLKEPTPEMKQIAKIYYSISLRNKIVLGPMGYPMYKATPKAEVVASLADDRLVELQKSTFKAPPPMNAALLAGIREAAAKRSTPAVSSPGASVASAPTRAPTPQSSPGAGNAGRQERKSSFKKPAPGGTPMMNELFQRVAQRREIRKDERVFQTMLATSDVITTSAQNGSLTVSKTEVPNTLLIEVHALTIFQRTVFTPSDLVYLKFSYPSGSTFANVKAKTDATKLDGIGHALFNLSRCKYPLPYDIDDSTLLVEAYRTSAEDKRGECLGVYELMNLQDCWGKTMEKALVRRRIPVRHRGKLIGEALCSFIFQNDSALDRPEHHNTSASQKMF